MAMSPTAVRDGEPHSEINTTPLIDVMLVLLVMLIVALPPQRHAIKLDTPRPPPQTQVVDRMAPVTIDIDFDDTIYWDGQAVALRDLDRRMTAEAHRSPQPEVHIQPHKMAKYRTVAAVMGAAQRNGINRMGVIGGTD